ncbi:hypothetical protein B4U80_02581 [Leptotrombidium deliense]|uniref:Cytochrome c oxidase assembly factor 4-like protein n=1 Tax=Leptotrombidium deliense TaxID=299467 RepID=A0A443SDW3_9ACAR|nr:hypothetical protein B4U80_02581 [Leptotrombidium deliense]
MSSKAHSYTVSENEDDPFEKAIKSTGCYDKHVQLQDCMFEHRDWRVCQPHVKQFKECMATYQLNKNKNDDVR